MNRTLELRSAAGQQAFLVRQGGPDDCDRIREFVCGLSPLSQYFRFFASVAPPSTALLRTLCGRTGADILLVTDDAGSLIGHGMAADSASPGQLATDIGLVIADAWQQQGLGTMLLDELVRRAAGRGVTQLVLDVLPANDRMLGIIERRWPGAPRERTRDAIVIRPGIGAAAAAIRLDRHRREGAAHAARQPAA
jgi:ribosomal protein S18 acetylase RimI-like enzyme